MGYCNRPLSVYASTEVLIAIVSDGSLHLPTQWAGIYRGVCVLYSIHGQHLGLCFDVDCVHVSRNTSTLVSQTSCWLRPV